MKGEWCGGRVVRGGGLGGAFISGAARVRGGHGGGLGMPRAARGCAGAASCGLGRHGDVSGGARGGVACVLAIGAGSGAYVSARVASVWACPPGARPVVGRHGSGKCGHCEGPGTMGLTWGVSGGHWLPPRHAGSGFGCWFVKCPWWWPCSWHGCLGLGFRVWGG